jgi:hypothetical protein
MEVSGLTYIVCGEYSRKYFARFVDIAGHILHIEKIKQKLSKRKTTEIFSRNI